MKRILVVLSLLCSVFMAQGQGIIFFQGTFDEAKAEAKKQNKYIFIDCWENGCVPCYYMDQEVFPLKAVGDFYNAHFICLKENMFVGEGIGIRGKYDINCFPTFIYLAIVGELAHYNCGSKRPDGLIELGK